MTEPLERQITSALEVSDLAKLEPYFTALSTRPAWSWTGDVVRATGQTVESEGPLCSVGEGCELIDANGVRRQGEVIGFRGNNVLTMPLDSTAGMRYGDTVKALCIAPTIAVGEQMLGRLLTPLGAPLDGRPYPKARVLWPLDGSVPRPMERKSIREPLQTGIRVIDGMLTVGRGQRVGVFGGSGVGKSTLIGMMTRNTAADLTVVSLVGERGREVREFVEEALGAEGLQKAVVLVSTSDQSPLLRMRAALAATSVAEFYASKGRHVLLVVDSLTRYAMAAREVGLASGEPPTTKGYTPSVFTKLAKLVERAGNFTTGSITAFYTVLMEGDNQHDPIVDAIRSFLDGHVVLSRALASSGQYPPVDVLDSLSRLMPAVVSGQHLDSAIRARHLLATYAKSEELIKIGAYKTGMDKELDLAIVVHSKMQSYVRQSSNQMALLSESVRQLSELISQ